MIIAVIFLNDALHSDAYVYMALNKNAGAAQRGGPSSYGGDCACPTLTGVTDVYSVPLVFMALNKNAGGTQLWGSLIVWRWLRKLGVHGSH